MGTRLELQTKLELLVGPSVKVYFQEPPNIQMVYPCISYRLSNIYTEHADNLPYQLCNEYSVTTIDENPDSIIPRKIGNLRSASFATRFTKDGLNHTVFNLYF